MIRYAVTQAELRERINDTAPTWLDKARERTEAYRVAGAYVKPPSDVWSEIKRAYMDLQGYKCGFCERRLERSEFGNVEHDVEHFRPKGMVEQWPPASAPERANGLNFSLGAASPGLGYFLLPHEPDNYLISCKTCNTAFKSNGFPVEGARELDMESPRHTNERPLLVYPIGSFDDDPQNLIRFERNRPSARSQIRPTTQARTDPYQLLRTRRTRWPSHRTVHHHRQPASRPRHRREHGPHEANRPAHAPSPDV